MEPADESLLSALVAELDQADEEHPDVAVSDESGWTLSAFRSGSIIWENVEEDVEPRHLTGVDRTSTLDLFAALLRQDFASIEARPWSEGYGR